MANEDFSTYTEVDPNSHITKTAAKATATDLLKAEVCYLYKDFGAGQFSGNFEFLFEGKVETTSDNDAHILVCSLANSLDDFEGCNGIGVMYYSYGSNQYFGVEERYGSLTQSDYYTDSANEGTLRYFKFKRVSSILYLYIYSDAARTNLLSTEQITLNNLDAYQYVYALRSKGSGAADGMDAYIEDLDLQVGAAGSRAFRGVLLATRGIIAPTSLGRTIAGFWSQFTPPELSKKLAGAATPVGALTVSFLDIVKVFLSGAAASAGAVLKTTYKNIISRQVRPTSYTSTTKWSSVANTYDGNVNTYATNIAANYDNYVELILEEPLWCEKIKIYAEDVS